MENTNNNITRTNIWGGKVHETLKSVEINVITPSLAFMSLVFVLAIIFGVPFTGAINVWPAYAWIYLLIILILYALIFWTIHGTASLGTVAFDTLALALVLLIHAYAFITLIWWMVTQPLGLTPPASSREFSFTMHAILWVAHLYRLVWDFSGVRQLVEVSMLVRKRLKTARRGQSDLRNVNGSDIDDDVEEVEMRSR